MAVWRTTAIRLMVAAAALVSVTGCGDDGEDAGDGREAVGDERRGVTAETDFYSRPEALDEEGRPGDILRVEAVDGLGGDGELLRVLYRSESIAGEPIAVSGLIAVPPGEPPAGGWPVISFAHGSVGLADICAPSREPNAQMAELAAKGYVLVSTDYEGLGTPGRHPFLVGESEGRGVIDAVRAARALGDRVGAGDRYAIIGYSQGGHAALIAREITATWAPELRLVGTVAGASGVELDTAVARLTDPSWDWLKLSIVAGYATIESAFDPEAVLTPLGREKLPRVDEVCSGELITELADGGLIASDLADTPPFDRLLVANSPARRGGTGPVLLLAGGLDTLVPLSLVDTAQTRLCAMGQVVNRRNYPAADHGGMVGSSLGHALIWAAQRLAGEPVVDICP